MSKIIGIDHGFGFMKTAHTSFLSGVTEMPNEPPLLTRVVEYKDKYYAIGGNRMNLSATKTNTEDYLILTLAGLAEEIKARGIKAKGHIYMAAGLPLKRMGNEKKEFKSYLLKNRELKFKYEGQPYHLVVDDLEIFPQGYAAIVKEIKSLPASAVLCDLGSFTFDILPISQKIPNIAKSQSLNGGIIKCMAEVQEELRSIFSQEVEESQIQDVITGGDGELPAEYLEIIKKVLKRYANSMIAKLNELGHNTDVTTVYWAGGGAWLIKNFGNYNPNKTQFILDIHANAKGYELLYQAVINQYKNQ